MTFLDSFDFEKPLSLYIHVPFCESKCNYCAFYSIPDNKLAENDLKKLYVDRLMEELQTVVTCMGTRPFETAYIGGGNPGCLGLKNLEKISALICKNGQPKEFTVEINPDSLTSEMISLGGMVTRISVGIQSLSEKALKFLGRNATLEQTYRGLELSQKLNLQAKIELNYDLITCLGAWHNSLEDVKNLTSNFPSNHLSVYALTLEEGTPLYKDLYNKHVLPDEDEQFDILNSVWSYLEGMGFEHYEVSNFAKAGKWGLHNCRYWAYQPYLGLGPGAASTAIKEGKVARFNEKKSVLEYGKGQRFDGLEAEFLRPDEALEELVLMGLRYKGGLDLGRVERDFGVQGMRARLQKELEGECGLTGFELKGNFLVPTDQGLMIADYVACKVIEILMKMC